MLNRPINTLYMLSSLDGKISTGDNDKLDFDEDLPTIKGIREGLKQYYDIEKTTDAWSLNTGRVMAKIGANTRKVSKKSAASFIIIDNKPHLRISGVKFMAAWAQKLILVTDNKDHPAWKMKINNMEVIEFSSKRGFHRLFEIFKKDFDINFITIQSGGTLNSELIREGLIDYVSIVVAPAMVGGKDTSTLMDGESLHNKFELKYIRVLKLLECKILDDSYLHLIYEVIN